MEDREQFLHDLNMISSVLYCLSNLALTAGTDKGLRLDELSYLIWLCQDKLKVALDNS